MLDIFLLSDLQAAEQGSGIVLRGGGSAANTAAWLSHCGIETAFAGCVGSDAQGAALVQELSASGVVAGIREVPDLETGAVLIRIEDDGAERVMQSSRGANTALTPDDVRDADLPVLSAVHLTGYALLCRYGLDVLEAAAQVAAAHRALLSFDPSSAGVINSVGADTLLRALQQYKIDILLPNAEEARTLTGESDVARAAKLLTDYVPNVVIKSGAKGVTFATHSGMHGVLRAALLRPIDPTGAGDAFDAGLLAWLVAGHSLGPACSSGIRTAGAALGKYGGRPSP